MVLKPSEDRADVRADLRRDPARGRRAEGRVQPRQRRLGPTSARRSASHPGIDMVSFTGSTRAGIEWSQRAAPTVKRVTQELGGKSANIILDDADLAEADRAAACAHVQQHRPVVQRADAHAGAAAASMDEAAAIAKAAADKAEGRRSARATDTTIGPGRQPTCSGRRSRASSRRASTRARRSVTGGARPARRAQQGLLRAPDRVRPRDATT